MDENAFTRRPRLPAEIVLAPAWWHDREGITFDESFFFHPARRVEEERRMERALYERWGRFGLGEHRHEDRPEIGAGAYYQFDILPDQAAEHLFHLAHGLVEVQKLGPAGLLAAEGQKPAGKIGAPFAGLLDFDHILVKRIVFPELHQQHPRMA